MSGDEPEQPESGSAQPADRGAGVDPLRALVTRAQGGDAEAMNDLLRSVQPRLRRSNGLKRSKPPLPL